jgi:AraC-like DNA-binding protein
MRQRPIERPPAATGQKTTVRLSETTRPRYLIGAVVPRERRPSPLSNPIESPRRVSFHRFSDPEAYIAALPLGSARFQAGRIKHYNGTVVSADLGEMGVGQGYAAVSATVHGQVTDRCAFILNALPGPDRILGGRVAPYGTIYHPPSNDSFVTQATGAASSWVALSIAYDDLSAMTVALTGRNLAPTRAAALFNHVPEAALRRMVTLGTQIAHLAENDPGQLLLPAAKAMLSSAMGEALTASLVEGQIEPDLAAAGRHRRIMIQLEAIGEANPGEPLSLAQLCGLLRVNARTLRLITHSFVGMGPTQYLRRHRLNHARRALAEADPRVTSIGDIAAAFDFWESGRFAGLYRATFGEWPSETLRNF